MFIHEFLSTRIQAGATIKRTNLTEEFTYDAFLERYGASAIALFTISGRGEVSIMTVANPPTPKAGQILISLVDEPEE